MKKIIVFILLAAVLLCGCDATIGSANGQITGDGAGVITLTGDSAKITGGGAKVDGSTVTISAAGEFTVSGKLDNGRIVVNTGDDAGKVIITLDNAEIYSLDGAAIYVEQARNLRLNLAKGSKNVLSSGVALSSMLPDDTASGAALYSKDDMDIEGDGELAIYGYINNGITCKDDLDINGGSVSVTALNNGIKGAESVEIKGGAVSVTSGNDGIKSTCTSKAGKGYVNISGGAVNISSVGDGIQAETAVSISGGAVCITAGEDGIKVGGETDSAAMDISGGMLLVASFADGLDVRGRLTVSGGEVLTLGTSKRIKGFSPDSTQPFIQTTFTGGKDVLFTVAIDGGGMELTCSQPFNTVLCSSPRMVRGQAYTLSCGNISAEAVAE